MSKLLSNIMFSFFLLFQTTAIADQDSIPMEANVEEMTVQETEVPVEVESAEVQEQDEPQETLSEAQKEALAAEEAELREAGVREEPIVE